MWSSGDAEVFRNVAIKLLGYSVNVQQAKS